LATPVEFHDQLQLVVPLALCHVPPSTDVWTLATLYEPAAADPDKVIVPATAEPDFGVEMVTVGGETTPPCLVPPEVPPPDPG
jgi:hypothetical protein